MVSSSLHYATSAILPMVHCGLNHIVIVVLSLPLVLSITALEMERRKEYLDFSFINISLFLLWQLLTLVSRLFAIILFAYVFRYYVFVPLAVHWSILVGSIFYIQISAGGNLR